MARDKKREAAFNRFKTAVDLGLDEDDYSLEHFGYGVPEVDIRLRLRIQPPGGTVTPAYVSEEQVPMVEPRGRNLYGRDFLGRLETVPVDTNCRREAVVKVEVSDFDQEGGRNFAYAGLLDVETLFQQGVRSRSIFSGELGQAVASTFREVLSKMADEGYFETEKRRTAKKAATRLFDETRDAFEARDLEGWLNHATARLGFGRITGEETLQGKVEMLMAMVRDKAHQERDQAWRELIQSMATQAKEQGE